MGAFCPFSLQRPDRPGQVSRPGSERPAPKGTAVETRRTRGPVLRTPEAATVPRAFPSLLPGPGPRVPVSGREPSRPAFTEGRPPPSPGVPLLGGPAVFQPPRSRSLSHTRVGATGQMLSDLHVRGHRQVRPPGALGRGHFWGPSETLEDRALGHRLSAMVTQEAYLPENSEAKAKGHGLDRRPWSVRDHVPQRTPLNG